MNASTPMGRKQFARLPFCGFMPTWERVGEGRVHQGRSEASVCKRHTVASQNCAYKIFRGPIRPLSPPIWRNPMFQEKRTQSLIYIFMRPGVCKKRQPARVQNKVVWCRGKSKSLSKYFLVVREGDSMGSFIYNPQKAQGAAQEICT